MDDEGIEGLIAATFDQPAATGEPQSPPESQEFSATEEPLSAPEQGDVPDHGADEVGAPAPESETPDWGAQFQSFQQSLPQQIAEQIQQSLYGYQQQQYQIQQQQQQQYQALVQALAAQQAQQAQRQRQEQDAVARNALLTSLNDAEPVDAMARLVAYFDQRQNQQAEQMRQQQQLQAQAFQAYQQQQYQQQQAYEQQQQEQESVGLVARHWQAQYGLTDDEAHQLLDARDPYQMGMQAQNIAYNRQLAGLTEKLDHLTKSVSVQNRVASGVDRVGNATGSSRAPRRMEDATNDDDVILAALGFDVG